jgi:hypothetical protein
MAILLESGMEPSNNETCPAMRYEIRIKTHSVWAWESWFPEFQVRLPGTDSQQSTEVCLTGCLPDQSALLGVLMRLHNLNLVILSVQGYEE